MNMLDIYCYSLLVIGAVLLMINTDQSPVKES